MPSNISFTDAVKIASELKIRGALPAVRPFRRRLSLNLRWKDRNAYNQAWRDANREHSRKYQRMWKRKKRGLSPERIKQLEARASQLD